MDRGGRERDSIIITIATITIPVIKPIESCKPSLSAAHDRESHPHAGASNGLVFFCS